jgi:putative two-component system response regulator
LRGDEIPVSGRLMALADVYDALTSKRVYKEAFSFEDAGEHIRSQSGKHFDPDVVDAFIDLEEIFKNIAISLHHHEHLA